MLIRAASDHDVEGLAMTPQFQLVPVTFARVAAVGLDHRKKVELSNIQASKPHCPIPRIVAKGNVRLR